MSTHNICFCGEIRKKKIPDTHYYLDLSVSMVKQIVRQTSDHEVLGLNQNSSYDYMVCYCTEPYFIIIPSSY